MPTTIAGAPYCTCPATDLHIIVGKVTDRVAQIGESRRDMGSLPAGPAADGPARWCSTSASSPRVTTFRDADDPGPDPEYPLQMWLCSVVRPGPAGGRPDRAGGADGRRAGRAGRPGRRRRRAGRRSGLLPAGGRVAEYGSPHGGSWLGPARRRGLTPCRRRRGRRCGARLLRHDARRRPARGAGRAGGTGSPGRRAAAAVPLPGHDRRAAGSGTRCATGTTPITRPPR